MSSILPEARAALEFAGYRTFMPEPAAHNFYFEDQSVLGTVCVMETVQQMLEEWESAQDKFLRDKAHLLVLDPLKAWNCYSVFLTNGQPGKNDASSLFGIEENFRGTRKIVRAGVCTRSDVEQALSPLLPLRRLLTLTTDDVKGRLAARLGESGVALQGLVSDTPVERVAASLLEAE